MLYANSLAANFSEIPRGNWNGATIVVCVHTLEIMPVPLPAASVVKSAPC